MINQPHSSSLTIRRIIAARSASRSLPIHVSYPHDFARKGRVKSNDNVTEPAIFTVVPAFENVTQPSGLVANCIGVATPSSGLGICGHARLAASPPDAPPRQRCPHIPSPGL